MESINNDCDWSTRKGRRSVPNKENSVSQIVSDLTEKDVFNYTEGRQGHPQFEAFDGHLFNKVDYKELHGWMSKKIELWGSIYENADT